MSLFISFLIEDVQPACARGQLGGTHLGDLTPGEVESRGVWLQEVCRGRLVQGAWLAEVCRVTGSSETVAPASALPLLPFKIN